VLQIAIGFILGALLFQRLPVLPSPWWLLLFTLVVPGWRKFPAFHLLPALAMGMLWSLAFAWITKPAEIPPQLLGQDIQIVGHIEQIPKHRLRSSSFLFRASELAHLGHQYPGDWLLRLSWYHDPPELISGDQWQFRVRLKQAHGFMNPGGFDYEGWLYAQGVKYTGYVRGDEQRMLGADPGLHRLRQIISSELASSITSQRAAAVVRALVVGDRSGLKSSDRLLFAATGTSHLMAISGLHVGLVAGLLYTLVRCTWRRIPLLCRRWPANTAAALAAMWGALMYAALAGFSVPTQRALIMLSLVMLALLLRHKVKPVHTLSMALLLVLGWNPLALISAGFWLSFVAVSVILFSASGRDHFRWLKIQFVVVLGLLPVLLAYQMQVALLSPLVNLLAIPLFGVFVVPMVLSASLLLFVWPTFAVWLLMIAEKVILLALDGLQFAADMSPAWQASGPLQPLALILWVIGLGLVLAPRGLPGRWLGVPMLLPLLFPFRQPVPQGEFYFTLLDVGQGLSAVVETTNHTLVFDTGPRFRSGFETGSQVVVPFLRHRGLEHADTLLLSHSDIDHTGGTLGLLEHIDVQNVLAGEPSEVKVNGSISRCVAGQQWQWDGVHFSILYPAAGTELEGNNASCVLKVSNTGGSVLLTGDVEADAEFRLVHQAGNKLNVDVVVAPHHGSASSSSSSFVSATGADHVLYSAGFVNRWGFPNAQVAQRWTAAGASAMNTGRSGAIRVHFGQQGFTLPSAYRKEARAWYHHH
jgi:competence protein ComEC